MIIDDLIKSHVFWPEIDNEFNQLFDFSKANIKDVFSNIDDNLNIKKNISLSSKVLEFYAYNEYFNQLRKDTSGFLAEKDLYQFKEYAKFLDDFSKKIFGYLLYSSIAECTNQESIDRYYIKNKKSLKDVEDKDFTDYKYYHNKLINDFYDTELLKNNSKSSDLFKKAQSFYGKSIILNKSLMIAFIKTQFSIPDTFKNDFLNSYNQNLYYYRDLILLKKSYKGVVKEEERQEFEKFMEFIVNSSILIGGKGHDDEYGEFQRKLIASKYVYKDKNIENMSIDKFLIHMKTFLSKGFDVGYAGENWQNIVSHLINYINGKISTEIFVDQALSLEHNNGNIFDKDFIFDKDSSHFRMTFFTDSGKERIKGINALSFVFSLQATGQITAFLKHDFKKSIESISVKNENLYSITKKLLENLESFRDFLLNNQSLKKIVNIDSEYVSAPFDFQKVMSSYIGKTKNKEFSELVVRSEKQISALSYALKNEGIKSSGHFSWVRLTDRDIADNEITADLVGAKALGVYELNKAGYRTPKAIAFDTKTCLSYLDNSKGFKKGLKSIKKEMDKFLHDEDGTPIMVSVRSGAPISMPGLMDTILNVGIDDNNYESLSKKYGKETIDKCAISFMNSFIKSKFNSNKKLSNNLNTAIVAFKSILAENNINFNPKEKFPLTAFEQVELCISVVFESVKNKRVTEWKNTQGIQSDLATAAIVQKMVLGNKNKESMTAVVFSRDPVTGDSSIMGEYLVNEQGEKLVGGQMTPKNIQILKQDNRAVYDEMERIAKELEKTHGKIQDIEFTVEDSMVYVLQKRNAVTSLNAQISLAKESELGLVDVVDVSSLISSNYADTTSEPEFFGLAANPGVLSGLVVKSFKDIEKYKPSGKKLIFVAKEALPEDVPLMLKTDAFVTQIGGVTSHAAIIARSLNKPCIVGISELNVKPGQDLTIDAQSGKIWLGSLSIKSNKELSENLAKKILSENNLKVKDKNVSFKKLILPAWNSKLKNSSFVGQEKIKYQEFLTLNQVAASLFLLESKRKYKKEFAK